VPVKLHGLVRPIGEPYVWIVTRCTGHVWAYARDRPSPNRYRRRFHPLDLEYETAEGWVRANHST